MTYIKNVETNQHKTFKVADTETEVIRMTKQIQLAVETSNCMIEEV